MSNSLWPHGLQLSKLLCPRNFSGKNIGIGCHFLLQASFQPRDQTLVSCVSCSGRWIFYHCATWEAPYYSITMVKSESEVAQSCLTLCYPMDCRLPGFSVYGIFPGNSTGLGCYFLLQGIFLTQGSNPGLLHCRQMLYPLSHQVQTLKFLLMFEFACNKIS